MKLSDESSDNGIGAGFLIVMCCVILLYTLTYLLVGRMFFIVFGVLVRVFGVRDWGAGCYLLFVFGV